MFATVPKFVVVWYDRLALLILPEMKIGGDQHNLFLVVVRLLDVCSYLNSTFNFIVYYVMGSRFRVTLWRLLGRKAKKAKSKQMTMTSSTHATGELCGRPIGS